MLAYHTLTCDRTVVLCPLRVKWIYRRHFMTVIHWANIYLVLIHVNRKICIKDCSCTYNLSSTNDSPMFFVPHKLKSLALDSIPVMCEHITSEMIDQPIHASSNESIFCRIKDVFDVWVVRLNDNVYVLSIMRYPSRPHAPHWCLSSPCVIHVLHEWSWTWSFVGNFI